MEYLTQPGQNQDINLKPAQIVILVDESGSIRSDDMTREQEAASLIGQSELSSSSTVSVVGFASDNGSKAPVDVVCPPIVLSGSAEREQVSQCVSGLRKRTPDEGDGTDHAEALKQALGYLRQGSAADGPKLIFLLTDGVLDVSDSPRYGVNKSGPQRNDAAREQIRQTLAQVRDAGVQVWPLGFGKLDKSALDGFASGGFQSSCGPTAPTPSATVVSSSNDVADALLRAFSSGRCAGIGPIDGRALGPGATVEIPVTIPPVATDGSIIVVKHNGRINVDYVDPQGKSAPKSGETGSGKFQVSGETAAVEVLHIVDPQPGVWTVRMSSPPGSPAENVLTTVTWQGAAQASIVVDPPSPAAGQPVTVSLQIVLRGGKPVTSPDLLKGMTFAAELTGDKTPTQQIPLQDNGHDPDGAPDGTYTGRLTIPRDAADHVTFRGTVSGLGISAADAVATVAVAPSVPLLLASATLPTIASQVAPGDSVQAKLTVTNNSGQRHKVQLRVLTGGNAGITIPPEDAVHDVDPGATTFPFRLAFAATSPQGVTTGRIQVVDGDDTSKVLHERPFTVDVAYPPPPFPWLRWILITLLAIAVLALVLWLVARRRSQEVKGLIVQAVRNGERTYLPTESRKAKEFRFTIDMNAAVPQLDIAPPGDSTAFVLTRSRAGLRLKTPFGEVRSMHLGDEVEAAEGLTVIVMTDPAVSAGEPDKPSGFGGLVPTDGWGGQGSAEQQPVRDPYL